MGFGSSIRFQAGERREGQDAGVRGFLSEGHVVSWIGGRKGRMKGKLRQRENEWDERDQRMGRSSVRSRSWCVERGAY